MTRLCADCGVPSWAPCVCDPRAGLDGPDPRNFTLPGPDELRARDERSRRAAVQHAIAADADTLLFATDPPGRPRTDAERIARLAEYLGELASDVSGNGGLDLDARLVRLGAGVQLWLEERAREAAR